MRVSIKNCPACQDEFQAKRKNQIYCSSDCRADINNNKLRLRIQNTKNLEKNNTVGEKYKAAYLAAIRIVNVQYNYSYSDKEEIIIFEGLKYKFYAHKENILYSMGITLQDHSIKGNARTAIYIPKEESIYLIRSKATSSLRSSHASQFKLIKPEVS